MNMKLISFYLAIGFQVGCARYATTPLNNPSCKTVVFGRLHCEQHWPNKYPALIVKENHQTRVYYGTIISVDSDGVTFDRDKEGILLTKPKYYENDKILCLIGETGQIEMGSIPNLVIAQWVLDLQIKPYSDSNAKPIFLELEPNKPFAFCLEPDKYKITGMVCRKRKNYVDIAIELPELVFSANQNTQTYIGDIYIDSLETDQNVIPISFKIARRPSDEVVGAVFGKTTQFLKKTLRADQRITHNITIRANSEAQSSIRSIITKNEK